MYRCVFDRAQAWLHNVCPAPQTRCSDTSSHVLHAGRPGGGFLKNRVSEKLGKDYLVVEDTQKKDNREIPLTLHYICGAEVTQGGL